MNKKESFVIQGLSGEKTLNGSVYINGAKNAALKAMAASILFEGKVILENMPDTNDVDTMANILSGLGAKISKNTNPNGRGCIFEINTDTINSTDIDKILAQGMRASIVLTGPLLSRFGSVSFPSPGGCVIGNRPIDLFVNGYKKMGAKDIIDNDVYKFTAKNGLNGTNIFFNIQTVGGTETLMMAGVLAHGTTILKNCAMEPEIVSIAEWLNSCGAHIDGIGTTTMIIHGTSGKLLKPKNKYFTLPDRIEAGSYLLLGAICADNIEIKNCVPSHLEAVTNLLIESGVPINVIGESTIKISNNSKIKNSSLKSFNVRTHEYPGFPTDLQSQVVSFLTQVSGESMIFETIFEGRFKFAEDLIRLGANITIMNSREILIKGPSSLSALPDDELLFAHDIRAGFAIVMAALIGKGQFKVSNVHLIDRGYEKLEQRLSSLGANIVRIND